MRTKVSSVILCDDVRKEISNKDILIGVFGGTMVVPSYPAAIRTAIWMELEPQEPGTRHLDIKIETPSGNPPIEIGFDLDVSEHGTTETTSFMVGGLPISLERDGEIVVSVKEDDGLWMVVKRKKVSRAPRPST